MWDQSQSLREKLLLRGPFVSPRRPSTLSSMENLPRETSEKHPPSPQFRQSRRHLVHSLIVTPYQSRLAMLNGRLPRRNYIAQLLFALTGPLELRWRLFAELVQDYFVHGICSNPLRRTKTANIQQSQSKGSEYCGRRRYTHRFDFPNPITRTCQPRI